MVAKDSCNTSTKIHIDQNCYPDKGVLLPEALSKMSINKINNIEDNNNTLKNNQEATKNNIEEFIQSILNDIFENAFNIAEPNTVMTRKTSLSFQEKQTRDLNRRVSILDDDENVVEVRNNYVNLHRRAISETFTGTNYVIDENENNDYTKDNKHNNKSIALEPPVVKEKEKKKKRISFNSLFGKKDKKTKESKEEEEKQDNLAQLPVFTSNSLGKSKKYASAVELSQHSHKSVLQRTPSFFRKLIHIGEDPANAIKRSLSFREVTKKPTKSSSREKLTEKKNQEWRQSLQSLVETDISVSYNDLSFVNYDALNDIQYEPVSLKAGCSGSKGYIGRTQSMIEKRSPNLQRPSYHRLSSASENNHLSATNLKVPSSAISLPALNHNHQDADNVSGSKTSIHKIRRRPQSINSDDGGSSGGLHFASSAGGSFRSVAGDCVNLKRHNAYRHKGRYTSALDDNGSGKSQTVSENFVIIRFIRKTY
ncbi:unnamed protein product [Diabrotica balteata]|uniref:Uncharacterized protein n=1 Tax=Diabrotica balteata TaxID=107213 RepID=A0A9N9XDF8_DIABA|nr:unnamed protein product [Diabrotica balteata]